MGSYAFAFCESLKTIELPRAVTVIGIRAFSDCYNLEEVKLSRFTTAIGVQAFLNCKNLKELRLPATIEKIDAGAFENTGLTELHCRAINPPALSGRMGYRGKVVVPFRSLETYKQTTGWQDCALE